ncbi:MAG: WecB/TagA/CpsF family glycosyltransferase [Clostridiales bacterium]|nr:WecB/TagA/CpsF family glycosyltransferase [Clostridiales bacterium]
MKEFDKCNILGVHIAVTTMQEMVDFLCDNEEELRGKYVCVSNVHTTVTAYEDKVYRKVQNNAIVAIPDGKPLELACKRCGYKQARRVAGPDLMLEIFAASEKKGYSHFFYGSTDETLECLKKNLLEKYPKLKIAGMYSPPFTKQSEEDDAEDIARINGAKPDFVWVGLGAPKQEIWMYEHRDKINAVMLGVGAGFDYHAGKIKRAPKWAQELCLEWLFRLIQDPKRLWKRYVSTNLKYLRLIAAHKPSRIEKK